MDVKTSVGYTARVYIYYVSWRDTLFYLITNSYDNVYAARSCDTPKTGQERDMVGVEKIIAASS